MFKIITDNGSDMPKSWLEENDVGCIYLSTILDGKIINGRDVQISAPDFYRLLAEGGQPSTSQANPEQVKSFFEEHKDEADEFLYIALSSGLSGTVGSAKIGIDDFCEEHPGKKVILVDSLNASFGQGQLVWNAVKMRNEGRSLEETAAAIEESRKNYLLAFTVDDLFDLWRGGRVSKTSAIIGTLASIKPYLIIDDEGKLVVPKKIRGRKKALDYLIEAMEEHKAAEQPENEEMIMIGHGNVPEDVEYVKQKITEKFGYKNFITGNLGPLIGAHTGASLVVVSYKGDRRY